MKKWIIILGTLFIAALIGAGIGYKYVYNKPHPDYEKAESDYIITAKELYYEYVNERTESEQKYNGKVIELTGLLNDIELHDSLAIAVFIFEEGMFGDQGIRATFLDKYIADAAKMKSNDIIKIKGYCTGYNDTDVILEKCSILKN
jgi:hypothetical protein